MEVKNRKFALLGEKLSHSYSKTIHNMLAPYEYELCPVPPEKLQSTISLSNYCGFNVTIPYKTAVMPLCDKISERATRIGSVNTLLKTEKGLCGYNTDWYGFSYMAECAGISFEHKNVLILGTGGTSKTARTVAADLGARDIKIVSRSGELNYKNVYADAKDSEIIINTTPLGMFPNNGASPVDLSRFNSLYAALDVIYNPMRTAFLLQAEKLGILCSDGLPMLVAQAKEAAEIFCGEKITDSETERVLCALRHKTQNIVLIGMPGCGKSTLGRFIADILSREFFDSDAEIEKKQGITIPEIFSKYGEEYFRNAESQVISELGKCHGAVIATGGGAVLRSCNMDALRQNGRVVFIERDISALPTDGRPLSEKGAMLEKLRLERLPLYKKYADMTIQNSGTQEQLFAVAEQLFADFL